MDNVRQSLKQSEEKNHQISFLKFAFAIVVVIGHMGCFSSYYNAFGRNGHFAVEFFFIVSGYFMVSSYMKKTSPDNADYAKETARFMKHKIKRLLLPFLTAVFFSFLLTQLNYMIFQNGTLKNLYYHTIQSIPEALGLIGSGFYPYALYGVRWYISAMLIAMLLLYYLLCRFKYTYIIVMAPLISIFLMAYRHKIMKGYGDWHEMSGIISMGMIRAICDICLGVVCYVVSEKIRRGNFTLFGKIFITLCEIAGWIAVLLGMYKIDFSYGVQHCLIIVLVFLISIIMSNKSYVSCLFRSKKWDILGTASLWIYLFHYNIIVLYNEHFPNLDFSHGFPLLCAAIVLYILLGYGTFRLISAYKDKIKRLFVK